eukprot:scaffold938_cov334-Pavlova_lutheri.AAC.11
MALVPLTLQSDECVYSLASMRGDNFSRVSLAGLLPPFVPGIVSREKGNAFLSERPPRIVIPRLTSTTTCAMCGLRTRSNLGGHGRGEMRSGSNHVRTTRTHPACSIRAL